VLLKQKVWCWAAAANTHRMAKLPKSGRQAGRQVIVLQLSRQLQSALHYKILSFLKVRNNTGPCS